MERRKQWWGTVVAVVCLVPALAVAEADRELIELWQLARHGDVLAQTALGVVYDLGEGVDQNHVTAAKWYRRAAQQGHPEAQYFLGLAYYDGKGVPQDYVQAYLWLNLAAAGTAGEQRAEVAAARDEVAGLLTPDQVAESQRLARTWRVQLPGAAEGGTSASDAP